MRNLVPTTEAVNRAIGHAQREAQRLDHAYIEPEHLLLGLALDSDGKAASLLKGFGVDLKKLRLSVEQQLEPGDLLDIPDISLSPRSRAILKRAESEASSLGQYGVEGEHVLLALLREERQIPYKVLTEMGVSYGRLRAKVDQQLAGKRMEQKAARSVSRIADAINWPAIRRVPIEPSPIFWGICLSAVVFALLMYFQIVPRAALVLFIISGWIVSLCLHEFGHAFVGYLGGDTQVYHKGYLTLNPIKYTHPVLSIALPVVFLFFGGIGLPGGAVYINRAVIRDRRVHSLISAAGPIATLICAVILLIPFITGIAYADLEAHPEFWAGVAMLAMLQVSGVIINLLPIPGLDGFNMLLPFLPDHIAARVAPLGRFMFLFLLVIFLTPIGAGLWNVIWAVCSAFNLEPDLAQRGLGLFRFWM
jgi:Zn-dependent protease